jgi:hypothetical protein
MAVKGTQKVLGGTPAKRYPDPNVSGTANAYGLYPWSAFDAPLIKNFDVGGNALPADNIANNTAVDVLVFTSDIPALSRSIVTDLVAGLQISRIAPNTLACLFVSATSGGAPGVSIAQYGQVLSGYVGTVYVTGFPLQITVNYPGTEGFADSVFLQVLANSPVINGVVGPLLGDSTLAPSPIILTAALYTQAIKDNGNIYQLNATAPQYQVVGLYDF